MELIIIGCYKLVTYQYAGNSYCKTKDKYNNEGKAEQVLKF